MKSASSSATCRACSWSSASKSIAARVCQYAPSIASGSEQWRSVRRQRADSPALAGVDEERKQVFQSALAQAEELWDAAAIVGPASRPLPLFYCVSQAGRAVSAAWTRDAEWRPRYHGLRRRESDAATPAERVFEYGAEVTSSALGIYPMVVDATASSSFEGFATVADLWASLPGWPTPNDLFGEDRPRCLTLEQVQLPGDTRPMFERLARPTHAVVRFKQVDVDELPTVYPSMAGVRQDGTRSTVWGGEEPLYTFVREDGTHRPLYEVGARVPGSGFLGGDLTVRPRVGDAAIGPPSVFLTLWALLFCLSELARYYPDTWVRGLDPDSSSAAVTLEHGLDLALEQTPSLISGALSGPIAVLMQQDLERREAEASAVIEEAPSTEEPIEES